MSSVTARRGLAYLRSNKLCNLVWDAYDDIVLACAKTWNFR